MTAHRTVLVWLLCRHRPPPPPLVSLSFAIQRAVQFGAITLRGQLQGAAAGSKHAATGLPRRVSLF